MWSVGNAGLASWFVEIFFFFLQFAYHLLHLPLLTPEGLRGDFDLNRKSRVVWLRSHPPSTQQDNITASIADWLQSSSGSRVSWWVLRGPKGSGGQPEVEAQNSLLRLSYLCSTCHKKASQDDWRLREPSFSRQWKEVLYSVVVKTTHLTGPKHDPDQSGPRPKEHLHWSMGQSGFHCQHHTIASTWS